MRRLLPGMIYRLPPKQNKADFMAVSKEERSMALSGIDRAQPIDKWLLGSFSGLSPLICRELAYRCGDDYQNLPSQLEALYDSVQAGDFMPYMLLRDGKPFDFSFLAIAQYGDGVSYERFESFSELLDAFYSRRDRAEQQRRRSHELLRSVKTARDRLARKLSSQREELKRTETREEVRHKADLITANLFKLKKGDSVLKCEDYYDPDCPEIAIPLDPLKTPQKNAAALYKEYNKLKAA